MNSIANKMNNTKSLIVDMKQKDFVKLDIVEIDKFETSLEENILPNILGTT